MHTKSNRAVTNIALALLFCGSLYFFVVTLFTDQQYLTGGKRAFKAALDRQEQRQP